MPADLIAPFARARCALSVVAFAMLAAPLHAHEGHDHGEAAPPAALAALEPRLALASERVELLAIRGSDRLWLYADGVADGAPLDGLMIDAEAGSAEVRAERADPGLYSLPLALVDGPATSAGTLLLTVSSADHADLFAAPTAALAAPPPAAAPAAGAGSALELLLLAGLAAVAARIGRRHRLRAGAFGLGAGLAAALAVSAPLAGHEGHDHADDPDAAAATAVPATALAATTARRSAGNPGGLITSAQRLADGSVLLPKPAQRLLGVTVQPVVNAPLAERRVLSGLVQADPRRAGRVEAPRAGRIEAPAGGTLPTLGQRVRAGDVLLRLAPVPDAETEARLRGELADVERDLAIADQQFRRAGGQRQQSAGPADSDDADAGADSRGVAGLPQTTFSIVGAQRDALRARQGFLKAALETPLPVRAPVGGVISAGSARLGAVVAAGAPLLEIVDPQALWIEALAEDPALATRLVAAEAVDGAGRHWPLRYAGRGYRLQAAAVPLQFALAEAGAAEALAIDQPVEVVVALDDGAAGVRLPIDAVHGQAQGRPRVWLRAAPERFVEQPVTVAADDGRHWRVGGLADGARVVVGGAAALDRAR